MAKKGQQAQLQQDIQTDEDWEKLLEKDGLIVVDIYSEWAGPCAAMQANLKKLKLEIGGDFLQLATGRADTVTALNRFADKSEPTWMFIAKAKMVNLAYGANSPYLQQLIINEMKIEKECLSGIRERVDKNPEDLTEEEQAEVEKLLEKEAERERIMAEKAFKQLTDRRVAQAKNILDTMAHLGLILVFPHAIKNFSDTMDPLWKKNGIAVSKKERPKITEEMLEEVEFFSPYKIPELSLANLLSDRSYAVTVTQEEGSPTAIDETVLRFIYGGLKKPPGDLNTPAQFLTKRILNVQSQKVSQISSMVEAQPEYEKELEELEEEESKEGDESKEEEEEKEKINTEPDEGFGPELEEISEPEYDEIWGVWAPANDLVKATALKNFFPLLTAPLIIPEPEPMPPHIAIAFEAFKRFDVLKLAEEYEEDVMNYGFFTTDNYESAKLIAKTRLKYEKTYDNTKFGEKLVLQISRKKSDAVLAFALLGPSHMSSNVVEGEKECSIFFPENYNTIEEITEVTQEKEVKVKKQEEEGTELELIVAEEVEGSEGVEGEEGVEGKDGEESGEGVDEGEVDRATSPMEGLLTVDD